MKYYILKPTKEERNTIYMVADLCKISVYPTTRSNSGMNSYPDLTLNLDDMCSERRIMGSSSGYHERVHLGGIVSVTQAIVLMTEFKVRIVKIKLNHEYSAEVDSEDGTVRVGCQTFTALTIQKFIKEYEKITK